MDLTAKQKGFVVHNLELSMRILVIFVFTFCGCEITGKLYIEKNNKELGKYGSEINFKKTDCQWRK